MSGRWRRWRGSIRGRLLSGFVLLFVLGLGASSLLTVVLVDDYLENRAGDDLRADAGRIRALLAAGPQTVDGDQLETLLGPPQGAIGLGPDHRILFTTGSAEGHTRALLAASGDDGTPDRPFSEHRYSGVRLTTPGLSVVLSDARSVAVEELILVTDDGVDGGAVLDFLARIALMTVLALAVLIGLALVVLRLGLRPLTQMAEAAEAIADGSREERIPVAGTGAETDVLAATLNRAFDAQADAETRARAFAADASHELRTPIATVSGWLELRRQGGLQGEAFESAIGRIEDEVGRIRLLVEELGLLARLDTGRPLDRTAVDLARLLTSVVEDARVIYPDIDITLEVELETGESGRVVGDAARLQQVVNNLVGNAVQHTPLGTAVRIRLDEAGPGEVRIVVADDGPGIAPADQPRLFDRFWRAESSRSRDYGGSGLGLSIVRAIVQAHDGRVVVSSEPGRGTSFVIHLPRAPR